MLIFTNLCFGEYIKLETNIKQTYNSFISYNCSLVIYSDYMSKKKIKTRHIDTDEAEQQIERETGDIYDDKQRVEMLEADGITAAENAFMQGRETTQKKRKTSTHKDSVSVELAAEEYTED